MDNIGKSLEAGASLKRCLDYLQSLFPVAEANLNVLDSRMKSLRVFPVEGAPAREIPPLPEEFCAWVKEHPLPGPTLLNEKNLGLIPPGLRGYFRRFTNYAQAMFLPLRLGDVILGIFTIFPPLGLAYTEEHLRRMAAVAEPFAMALSNAIIYRELLRYSDRLLDDRAFLRKELAAPRPIIGREGGLAGVMAQVAHVAPLSTTVLVTGETGVGKELVAGAIHEMSPRRDGPFIKVNCGAIADSLVDSELFGYEKGAFTGAVAVRRGRFERAEGGTIFLDEVGELSPGAQLRLLRVLAEREIERVGGNRVIKLDIRVIAATHRDLRRLVEAGRFRDDLWFRLNVYPLRVPPLRERREDIPAFLDYFLSLKSRELGVSPPAVAAGGLRRLMAYDWPGNVREMENVVERELIRAPAGELTFEQALPAAPVAAAAPATDAGGPFPSLDEAMLEHMQQALKLSGGRVSGPGGAAERLKIHPNTLRSRLKKLGWAPPGRRG